MSGIVLTHGLCQEGTDWDLFEREVPVFLSVPAVGQGIAGRLLLVMSPICISTQALVLILSAFLPIGLQVQSVSAAEAGPPAASASTSPATPIEQALLDVKSEDAAVRSKAVSFLIETGDASLIPKLDAIRAEADRAIRQAIKPVIDLLKNHANLTSEQADTRRSAAADLVGSGRPEAIAWLEEAAAKEQVWWVKYTMEESARLLQLRSEEQVVRLVAVKKLGELRSQNGLSAIKEFVDAGAQSGATDEQRALAEVARVSIGQIESWSWWAGAIETLFRGVSLSSILLMMSLGLAIVFGLMGVINMAHGELMMIGAYATFVTQQAFLAWMSPELFDWYFPVALPVAFLAAAAFGWVLEATVVRFLYGRLLETLLATWGVSLILMQAARVYFGDLTAVIAPQALRGGAQVMVGVYLPYNRIFIITPLDRVRPGDLFLIVPIQPGDSGPVGDAESQYERLSRDPDAKSRLLHLRLCLRVGRDRRLGAHHGRQCRSGTGTELYRRRLHGRRDRGGRKARRDDLGLVRHRGVEQIDRAGQWRRLWQGLYLGRGDFIPAMAAAGIVCGQRTQRRCLNKLSLARAAGKRCPFT